ncbi:hypothetical protein ACO0QE_004088 [Hanseniaspora vineae]
MIIRTLLSAVCYFAILVSSSVCDKQGTYKALSITSPVSTIDYQKIVLYLEQQGCAASDDMDVLKFYEENLYQLGLKKIMEDEEHEAIQYFQKISKTHWRNLSASRLASLNVKYGIGNPPEVESLPIHERISISPYSQAYRVEFINHLLYEIENFENESDVIYNVQQIVDSYQIILDKYRKSLSLGQRVEMYSKISILQTFILNNSKAALKALKQCYDLDMDNKVCTSFLKLQNKLSKVTKQADGYLYFDSQFDSNWATTYLKHIENSKKPLIKEVTGALSLDFLKIFPEIKKFYKGSDLPLVKNLYVLSTIAHDTQNVLEKKKTADSPYLRKLIDVRKQYSEEELKVLWEELSPHIAMKILLKIDTKQAQKFLKERDNCWDAQVQNTNSPWFHKALNALHAKLAKIAQKEQEQQQDFFRKFQQQQQQHFQGGRQFFQGGPGGHHQYQHHYQHQQQQQHHHQQAPPPSGVNPEKDYYKILGVGNGASSKEVRSAYLKLIKQNHPDKQKTQEDKEKVENLVHDINEAYEVLNDEDKRKEYDSARSSHGRGRYF